MPPSASRTIFIANIPYDVSEEQLANVFSEVGPVMNVEIKFDPATGKSKGYAFVQFYDEATALSAVRNLQDSPVNGRQLRVELSTDEPGPRRRNGPPMPGGRDFDSRHEDTPPPRGFRGGAPGPGMGGGMGGPGGPGGLGGPGVDLGQLPQGVELPPGVKATDAITKTLAAISPGQMQDVMASMKTLVTTNPDQARQLLNQQPQLAYAIFQAMLLMNIVDASVLQNISPLPAAQPSYAQQPPAFPPYPPSNAPPAPYPSYPPPNASFRPPPANASYGAPPAPVYGGGGGGGGYGAPPQAAVPPPAPVALGPPGMSSLPPAAQAALSALPQDQQAMLIQVLTLTPEQVNALDASQKASIMTLRQQFLG